MFRFKCYFAGQDNTFLNLFEFGNNAKSINFLCKKGKNNK
jgi:hypothetical protein